METGLETGRGHTLVQVGFDGAPSIRATANLDTRSVILEFEKSRVPVEHRRFKLTGKLVESAKFEQVGAAKVRLVVTVAPETRVTVYRRTGVEPHMLRCFLLVQPDRENELTWPVHGRVSSRFGWRIHPILNVGRMHKGVDLAVPEGTPIRAAARGRVVFAGRRGGAGLCVIVAHANGLRSTYMHCSKILVRRGELVARNRVLAKAGSTGLSTGSHVHFGISKGNRALDPARYLAQKKKSGPSHPR